jgi:hypothetical protein
MAMRLEKEHWHSSKPPVPFMKLFGRIFFPVVGVPYYYNQYRKIQQAKKGLGEPRIAGDRARQSQIQR